jgi:hypothetical protein
MLLVRLTLRAIGRNFFGRLHDNHIIQYFCTTTHDTATYYTLFEAKINQSDPREAFEGIEASFSLVMA